MGTIFLPQIIIGFGNGLLLPTSVAGAVSIRPQVAGTASGMTGFIQMAIGAAAAQLGGLVVAHATGCHAAAAADAGVRRRDCRRRFHAGAPLESSSEPAPVARQLRPYHRPRPIARHLVPRQWNWARSAALVSPHYSLERGHTMLTTILIIVLILALVGALPTWGYSRDWGYGPGGGLGLILLIIVVLALTGHI